MSCGCRSSITQLKAAPRRSGSRGPSTVRPGTSSRAASICTHSSRSCARMRSSPMSSRNSTAAASPTASAMGGVPASNLSGISAKVDPSVATSLIISPPPRKGSIACSTAGRPARHPMPVGPHSLWPVNTRKSASIAAASTGMCGTLCVASTSASAPASCAMATMSATGLMVPSTFEECTTPTRRVRGLMSPARASMSSSPPGVMGANTTRAPVMVATICHGTMSEWCSISVTRISSPSRSVRVPHAQATRLMASVAFLASTSPSRGWFTRRAAAVRPASKRSVASAAISYTPRCTLALVSR